jgi:hypothetical protein
MSSNYNNNSNTCASPSCRHTCRVCGHKRCYFPRCGPLRFEIRIVSSTRRRRRDPSMNWRKILARPKCCKCLQRQPKPIHLIDLVEKERLTFIEFAAFKKEDDSSPSRRSTFSPEEHTRLILEILKKAQKPQASPPTTPTSNPPNPTCRDPRGPDQDDPSGGASATQITAFRASIPPSKYMAQLDSSHASHRLEFGIQRSYTVARRLWTVLSGHTHHRVPIRRSLRVLFHRLAALTHRLHPELSSSICPDSSWTQARLNRARNKLQLAWKGLFGVALGAGLLGRCDRRAHETVLGEEVVMDLERKVWELLRALSAWDATVREGGIVFIED